mmetsp:Transcript_10683/g.35375  ORF Transcript_10683/g.35375 Transcript_10683/m.35375 type:complete len:204 (+) Transcript_10683:1345-1956(+)
MRKTKVWKEASSFLFVVKDLATSTPAGKQKEAISAGVISRKERGSFVEASSSSSDQRTRGEKAPASVGCRESFGGSDSGGGGGGPLCFVVFFWREALTSQRAEAFHRCLTVSQGRALASVSSPDASSTSLAASHASGRPTSISCSNSRSETPRSFFWNFWRRSAVVPVFDDDDKAGLLEDSEGFFSRALVPKAEGMPALATAS